MWFNMRYCTHLNLGHGVNLLTSVNKLAHVSSDLHFVLISQIYCIITRVSLIGEPEFLNSSSLTSKPTLDVELSCSFFGYFSFQKNVCLIKTDK